MNADISRRTLMVGAVAVTGALALSSPAAASSAPSLDCSNSESVRRFFAQPRNRAVALQWARHTWHSMVAMTDPQTGLPADNIAKGLSAAERSGYTSPTNIGGYLWSTVVARDLGLISRTESVRRLSQTLSTLQGMEKHQPSGMYYNWYDERTAQKLTSWPGSGDPVQPFLSSVDNGWLAAALMVVRSAEPRVSRQAQQLLDQMNFAAFYDKDARPAMKTGLIRGGFWVTEPSGTNVPGDYLGTGTSVYYTANHYDTTVSETRIASYIGISRGQIPAESYFATWRTFPGSDDWSWQEQKPVGQTRRYRGIDVYEGAYSYRGFRVVPGWGGSMFEALMPDMFVPEAQWAPHSWGVNHPLTVRAHREHGLLEAKYGYWGFSPASNPLGGYSEWGVDAIGLSSDGYFSDLERSNVDLGYPPVRPASNPEPNFGDGVVTPHAAFLALSHEPAEAFQNLQKIQRVLGAYGAGGFYDAVAVKSGTVAERYLSLDQAMVLGSLGNVLANNTIKRAFIKGEISRVIPGLIGAEVFGAGE